MSYIIGSFNTQKLNMAATEESRKNFAKFAQIIQNEGFDVIALQEVKSELAVKQITQKLGLNWSYKYIEPKTARQFMGDSRHAAEGYAYLWNTKKLRLVEDSTPYIYTANAASTKLVRPPLVARFTPLGLLGGSFFEIRLINVHVAFGKPNRANTELGDIAYRREELKVLAEEVYPRVADKRYGNNMPAYTILMGDYNLCIAGIGPKVTSAAPFDTIPINTNRRLRTVQSELTSLKQPSDSDSTDEEEESDTLQAGDLNYYSKNYDHFSFEVTLLDKLSLSASRVEAVGKYYGNQLEDYRREISDHVPIKLVLNLRR